MTTSSKMILCSKGVDGIIQEEAELLIRTLLEDSSSSEGGTILISGQKLNVPVVNVLWQIVASKRFDPRAQETKYSTYPYSLKPN